MSYNAKTKPRFETGDKLTNFLGQWGEYDLYYDSGCCIARNGNEPHEYLAGPWRVYAEQALNGRPYLDGQHRSATLECFFRAYRSNLLPKLQELRQYSKNIEMDAKRWKVAKEVHELSTEAIDSWIG